MMELVIENVEFEIEEPEEDMSEEDKPDIKDLENIEELTRRLKALKYATSEILLEHETPIFTPTVTPPKT